MGQATKGFHEALREVYEPEWPGNDHVRAMSHSIELLWDDYCEKLTDQALTPLGAYSNQFTEVKTKVAKRGRKLVDYDGARHNFETLRANSKKSDEAKVQKAQEQLTVAKRIFDDINIDLLESLPALYDSRITFYVNNFQTIFNLEQTFHGESSKLTRQLCNQMDELGHSLGRLRVPRTSISGGGYNTTTTIEKVNNDIIRSEDSTFPSPNENHDHPGAERQPEKTPPETRKVNDKVHPTASEEALPADDENRNGEEETKTANPFDSSSDGGGSRSGSRYGSQDSSSGIIIEKTTNKVGDDKAKELPKDTQEIRPPEQPPAEQVVEVAVPAPTTPSVKPPPEPTQETSSVLYKVRATHRYTAEDTDEISFEPGEVIDVVSYDDPEEQDEGWLMGIKQSTGEKGVFPANFTKQF